MHKNKLKLFILIVSKSVKERMKNKSNEMHVSKTMVAFKIRFTNIMKRYCTNDDQTPISRKIIKSKL